LLLFNRMTVCCGTVYKSDSDDLILIDVAKFKPCQRKYRGSVAHLVSATRRAQLTGDNSHLSATSTNNLSTQDKARRDDLAEPDQNTNHSSHPLSSVAAAEEWDNDEDSDDEDDSYSCLHTDESLEPMSPSQDDEEPAAAADRSILYNLLWSSRHSQSDSPENGSDFIWSDTVNIWRPSHALSKPSASPVEVFP